MRTELALQLAETNVFAALKSKVISDPTHSRIEINAGVDSQLADLR
jgi:hypothetical protein